MEETTDVVLVGAGASGILTAVHLATQCPTGERRLRVDLVDLRAPTDVGLAYSTRDPGHVMNVRSCDLSAFREQPDHFVEWLVRRSPVGARGFAPRRTYRAYLLDLLQDAENRIALRRRVGRAVGLDSSTLLLDDGTALRCRHVVLGLGHATPRSLDLAGGSLGNPSGLVDDPWANEALSRIGVDDTVVLVGSGLTAVDMVISLSCRGHRGPITVVSSTGEWPRRHHPVGAPAGAPVVSPGMTVRQAVRAVRHALAEAESAGQDWRPVIDGLRSVTVDVWRAWDDTERRQFLRLVRRHWDRHRHRIAPAAAQDIARLEHAGQLVRCRGRVLGVSLSSGGRHRLRVETAGLPPFTADWVINCAGPDPRLDARADPLVDDLLESGRARLGWNGWGLDTDADGRVLSSSGDPSKLLSAIGPMRVGQLWESIAIPEISRQAQHLASRVLQELGASDRLGVAAVGAAWAPRC